MDLNAVLNSVTAGLLLAAIVALVKLIWAMGALTVKMAAHEVLDAERIADIKDALATLREDVRQAWTR